MLGPKLGDEAKKPSDGAKEPVQVMGQSGLFILRYWQSCAGTKALEISDLAKRLCDGAKRPGDGVKHPMQTMCLSESSYTHSTVLEVQVFGKQNF